MKRLQYSPRITETAVLARDILEGNEVPYLLGGGLAVREYGHPRASSDVDFYIMRQDADRALDALSEAGFRTRRSDSEWIYQAWKKRTRVDLIFNITSGIDMNETVMSRGERRDVEGHQFVVVSREDLLAIKISIQYENRPDWWDAASIVQRHWETLDWDIVISYSHVTPAKFLAFCLWSISEARDGTRPIPAWMFDALWQEVGKHIQELPVEKGFIKAKREDWQVPLEST
ncbi:MAG: nucleotidyltransferase [bacterium]|nr:nucleotidyltransferase [bacterium]